MIVVGLDELKKMLKGGEYMIAHIWQGHVSDIESYPFHNIDEKNANGLIDKLTSFSKMYPHKFTLWLKKTPNGNQRGTQLMHVDFATAPQTVTHAPGFTLNGNMDMAAMRQQITSEVTEQLRREEQLRAKDREIEMLKANHAQSQDPLNKIALIISGFMQNSNNPNAINQAFATPQMQGPQHQQQMPQQTQQPNISNEEFEATMLAALKLLRHKLGDETILKLASRFEHADPMTDPTIKMVQNFVM